VVKEGVNKGRLFYKCAASASFGNDSAGCGFFEFQDEPSSHGASSATQALIMNTVNISM
jgi:hypothetical protein